MHTTEQLNTALDGRYVIERRIGAGENLGDRELAAADESGEGR
jgi:hypothetical protein